MIDSSLRVTAVALLLGASAALCDGRSGRPALTVTELKKQVQQLCFELDGMKSEPNRAPVQRASGASDPERDGTALTVTREAAIATSVLPTTVEPVQDLEYALPAANDELERIERLKQRREIIVRRYGSVADYVVHTMEARLAVPHPEAVPAAPAVAAVAASAAEPTSGSALPRPAPDVSIQAALPARLPPGFKTIQVEPVPPPAAAAQEPGTPVAALSNPPVPAAATAEPLSGQALAEFNAARERLKRLRQ